MSWRSLVLAGREAVDQRVDVAARAGRTRDAVAVGAVVVVAARSRAEDDDGRDRAGRRSRRTSRGVPPCRSQVARRVPGDRYVSVRMRIVAGELRGRRLRRPPRRVTRPTTDKVREAVFNALASLDAVVDAGVADLYAGSGALGIEALSRGAAHCTFVERDRGAVGAIDENIAALGLRERSRVVVGDGIASAPQLRRRPRVRRPAVRLRRLAAAARAPCRPTSSSPRPPREVPAPPAGSRAGSSATAARG